jgi:simple sugar transport system ATP-binding protein
MAETDLASPPERDGGPLLRARHITKCFGSLVANADIDLDVWPSEIHALLGENGAGKSTLVKIIYGLLTPDAGQIFWRGKPVDLKSPAEARALGVGMVFQHFSLFENLTVAENIALGLSISPAQLSVRVAELSRAYGLPLEPTREVWRLSVGERQRIEIVRCLLQEPQLLILDEPTAVLTPQESEQLFATLRLLQGEGRTILYISHRLEEVRALCETATILRAGRKIAACDPRKESAASLARMMVGSAVTNVRSDRKIRGGAPRLTVTNLTLAPEDPHGVHLDGVSLTVHAGEIVGIAGVAGNGQDELFAVLSGERRAPVSTIVADGKDVGASSINDRRRLGMAFVPDERLGHACAPDFTLSENVLVSSHIDARLVHRGFIDRAATMRLVERIRRGFDVRASEGDPQAVSLSGGNLQKFVVGRELVREPRILIINQPTWGLDAGAAAAIRQALIDLAGRDTAVLVISQDLDELEAIADRIAVIYRGRLTAALPATLLDREQIGLYMGGVRDVAVGEATDVPHH